MDYSSEVRQRFSAPARSGEIPDALSGICEGTGEDRSLPVWVRFQLEVRAGTIERVRFRAFGCPHTLAAADWVAALLEGSSVEALITVDWSALAGLLALPREKFGKLLRIEDALADCYAQAKQLQEGTGTWPSH